MSRNLEIEESLIDKSANLFTSTPQFAELVALVEKFHDLLGLTPFTYFDLEFALQHEANQQVGPDKASITNGEMPERAHSELVENFVAEILHFFSIRFDRSNMYRKLYSMIGHINRWCVPPFDTHLMLPPKKEHTPEKEEAKQNGGGGGGGLEPEDEEEEEEGTESSGKSRSQSKLEMREGSVSVVSQESYGRGQLEDKATTQNGGNMLKMSIGNDRRRTSHLNPDYLHMSSEDKLKLFCFLIDAQLACAEDTGHLDESFPSEQQRIHPFLTDSNGRKFWYFGDTWLFMEEGKLFDAEEEEEKAKQKEEARMMERKKMEEEQKAKGKSKKSNKSGKSAKSDTANEGNTAKITQSELDEAYGQLFTSLSLRVVCKNAEHFAALIEAYKKQRTKKNTEIIEKLEECMEKVRDIEQERLRKAAEQAKKSVSPMRQSSRIAKILEKQKVEAEQRQRRHAAIMAERKRIEQDQAEFLREHRRLTDSDIQMPTMSREERLKLRQQRVQDLLEREQLIEAGLLTPSPSTVTDEGLDDEEDDAFESDGEMLGKRRSSRKRKETTYYDDVEYGQQQQKRAIPRMGALDWWPKDGSMATTSSDGSFISLFQTKSPLEKRPSTLKRLHERTGLSLIAPRQPLSPKPFTLPDGYTTHGYGTRNSRIAANSLENMYGRYRGEGFEQIRNVLKLATPVQHSTPKLASFLRPTLQMPAPIKYNWARINPSTVLGGYKSTSMSASMAAENGKNHIEPDGQRNAVEEVAKTTEETSALEQNNNINKSPYEPSGNPEKPVNEEEMDSEQQELELDKHQIQEAAIP